MQRRFAAIVSVVFLVISLVPAPRAQALEDRPVFYQVYYQGVCGPCYPSLEGEWTVDCYGVWSGWGWLPGQYAQSRTETTYGLPCGDLEP